jgi:hypothetical protein
MNDNSKPFQAPDLTGAPLAQRIGLGLHISNDIIQRDWKNELRMTNPSDLLSIGPLKENILTTNVQHQPRPWPLTVLAQFLGNLAELRKRHFVIVARYRNYPKADKIVEGIDSTKWAARAF